MDFLPNVKSLDKLLNSDWKNFVYGEQSETWKEKWYSFGLQAWKEILEFLESRGRQLQNYWPLVSAFFVVLFIILATYKSLKYVGSIKLRKPDKCEQRVKQEISTEERRIISDDGNDDDNTECSAEKPCPTSRSVLDSATATSADNDYHSRHDSSVSSVTTLVTAEGNESSEFFRNLINSVKPGDDAVDHIVIAKHSRDNTEENKEMPDLPESTREKVDSSNCKQFYMLTPWIGPPEEQESRVSIEKLLPFLNYETKTESLIREKICSKIVKHEQAKKNVTDNSDLIKLASSPEAATVKTKSTDEENSSGQTTSQSTNSTMAIYHESSSIYCADQLLSRISDIDENITSRTNIEKQRELCIIPKIEPRSNDLERVLSNFVQQLPELNLSPISREPLMIVGTTDNKKSEARTETKQRFRSFSHDNRSLSIAQHVDARRGCSVSPPARNKSKQRFVKQIQSKIPTAGPLTPRQMHQNLGTDETAETANQIRSVLLRKLKEVWVQHPRDRTPSPNRSINSSLESSVYYTPENMSRIPLPRRSPRDGDTNVETGSSRVSSQSDRLTNQSGQSRPGHSGIRSDRSSPDDGLWVPLHSTPKTSPSSRGSKPRR